MPTMTLSAIDRIPGIGEKTAQRLASAGLGTPRALAGASVDTIIAAAGAPLRSRQQVTAWRRAAAGLAKQKAPSHRAAAGPAKKAPPGRAAAGPAKKAPPGRAAAGPARKAQPSPPPTGSTASALARVRRTFTVELQFEAVTAAIVAGRVVELSTQEFDEWPSWAPERLTSFVEARFPTADAAAATRSSAAVAPGPAPVSHVHAFGVVAADGTYTAGAEVQARLHLDLPRLSLPGQRRAEVQVELLARSAGRRAAPIATKTQLVDGRTRCDVVVGGVLPDGDGPVSLAVTVRVRADGAPPSGAPIRLEDVPLEVVEVR